MAYAVFKMCSRASTRHASDGFPLIFFFLVAKGLFEPFFVGPTGPTTNYSHASVLALLVLATRSSTLHAKRTLFPCSLPSAKHFEKDNRAVLVKE